MKRKIAFVLAAALTLGLTACGAANDADNTGNSSAQSESGQTAEGGVQDSQGSVESGVQDSQDSVESSAQDNGDNATESDDNAENAGTGKVLIAYFAVAENSDVDAVSSASVMEVNGEAKGLVRTVAEDIQAVTGGDLFSIETSVNYPGDINDLIEYASVEQENDERPELTSHIENLDEYDTIFVGYPLWWYVAPTIINTFLESYDFSGKTIIPFATSGGSGMGRTNDKLKLSCPGATLLQGRLLNGNLSEDSLKKWVKDLNL